MAQCTKGHSTKKNDLTGMAQKDEIWESTSTRESGIMGLNKDMGLRLTRREESDTTAHSKEA